MIEFWKLNLNPITMYGVKKDTKEVPSDWVRLKDIPVDLVKYISTSDLMNMFNYKRSKSWDISNKHNLIKYRFKGNIVYYEREIAIEVFSKYKN